jgi:RNA polymerase sigma factor (sigma-70 family)
MAEFSRLSSAGADDQALLERLRGGDDSAFGALFTRHADAVRRFAMQQVRDSAEADDLTAEAFFRVLQAIRRGNGPTDHVRTYLLTVARRVAWEWSARRWDVPVEDEELDRRAEPYADNSVRLAESSLITQAFSSLPERWRTVLWQVEVEGERPAVVAPHFGLSANATAALARRAREGLRAAYLQAHLSQRLGATACQSVREKLGGYTAGTVKGLEGRKIKAHLRGCDQCTSLQGELREVCSTLRTHAALLVPVGGVGIATAAIITGHTAAGTGLGLGSAAIGKGVLLASRLKLVLTAGSVAAVGVFGIAIGPWLSHSGIALPDNSNHQIVNTYCVQTPSAGVPTAGGGGNGGGDPAAGFANPRHTAGLAAAEGGAKTVLVIKQDPPQSDPPQQTTDPTTTPTSSGTETTTSTTPTSVNVLGSYGPTTTTPTKVAIKSAPTSTPAVTTPPPTGTIGRTRSPAR